MSTTKILSQLAIRVSHPISDTGSGGNTIESVSMQVSFPFNENASQRSTIVDVPLVRAGAKLGNGEKTTMQNNSFVKIEKHLAK